MLDFWAISFSTYGIAEGKWLLTKFFLPILKFNSFRQEAFMQNYFTSQRDQIFRNVEVLIYVFDVESRDIETDLHYYQTCLEALLQNSPEAKVFCLIHKLDLVQEDQRDIVREEHISKL